MATRSAEDMVTQETPADALSKAQYSAIAAFRFELRRFLAFSEAVAAKLGLPAQQHQALLTIAGYEGAPTVGALADQLFVEPHTAAELVSRMAQAGLLKKTSSMQDRRRVELALTAKAQDLLNQLTVAHLAELRTLEPALARVLEKVGGGMAL
jgi:DNA-binding MarR family transcriptional regulator